MTPFWNTAKDKIGPHDVVCAAESVVAITQDGAKRCEDFKPGFLAKTLCHLFPAKGSISGWYSMQALLDAEGAMKVIIAVICGFAAKCVGKRGVFYQMAGYQARLIDDVTGTMPPYDKHIVYGPFEPHKVSESIKKPPALTARPLPTLMTLSVPPCLAGAKALTLTRLPEF